METIQQELSTLHLKVDRLFQLIETLNARVSDGLSSGLPHELEPGADGDEQTPALRHKYQNLYARERETQIEDKEDKDLISDRSILNINSHSHRHKDFSPEAQIQRLTAQLTAAYNRIAALEEQLLARRVG
jgi:hypothetical protein